MAVSIDLLCTLENAVGASVRYRLGCPDRGRLYGRIVREKSCCAWFRGSSSVGW